MVFGEIIGCIFYSQFAANMVSTSDKIAFDILCFGVPTTPFIILTAYVGAKKSK
jgi:hypothetical protein